MGNSKQGSDWVFVADAIMLSAYLKFEKTYYPGSSGKGFEFWKFIGMNREPDFRVAAADGKYPPDAARLLHMLAGPYGETIMKMLVLRGRDPTDRIWEY